MNPSHQLDDFWTIALSGDGEAPPKSERGGDGEHENENSFVDDVLQVARGLKTYSLPDGIVLNGSSLPQTEGIWSPLGAQVWHASSLLACYLISHRAALFEQVKSDDHVTVLEIGSGAVGLSGMALAAVFESSNRSASVLLTDLPEDGILKNLQNNVNRNKSSSFPSIDVQVQPLDWGDYINATSVPSLPQLDLVIGSELIYTEETARSCAAVVTHLLQKNNPKLLIVILQVTDRPGFETHFLPLLHDLHVRIQQPLDAELHEAASLLVASAGDKLVGTLDRCAYGLCWIRRKEQSMT
jgi:predicted nicotinamide N-methyase